MAIIGFNFTKIQIEKKTAPAGNIGIRNNVLVRELKKADLPLASSKQNCLMFSFEFTSRYEPDVASMLYAGDVLFMDTEEKTNKILESWNKDKSIPHDTLREVLNTVLARCNVQAIVMSQEMGLPSPVPLPRIDDRPQDKQGMLQEDTQEKVKQQSEKEEQEHQKQAKQQPEQPRPQKPSKK